MQGDGIDTLSKFLHKSDVPAHRGSESHSCSSRLQPRCILHRLGPRLSWVCRSNILWLTKFSLPSFGFHQDPAVVPGSGQDFSSESCQQASVQLMQRRPRAGNERARVLRVPSPAQPLTLPAGRAFIPRSSGPERSFQTHSHNFSRNWFQSNMKKAVIYPHE